eukprot:scaffold20350_cov74-Isochrysis_galbana.AAC.1
MASEKRQVRIEQARNRTRDRARTEKARNRSRARARIEQARNRTRARAKVRPEAGIEPAKNERGARGRQDEVTGEGQE